jgi:HSP20 family protein
MAQKSPVAVGRRNDIARSTNPFEFLHSEIDRLFGDFTRSFPSFRTPALVPNMDVTETDKDIEITMELPGLEEKDVEVNVSDNVLTVRGEKKAEKEESKDKNHWLLERSYGSFMRSLTLPDGVKAEDIKADIAKGVLTVKVPKPAQAQAKRIDVKAAA